MEKEIKKRFFPGQSSKIYKNAKNINICIVCIFREVDQHNNDSGEEVCSSEKDQALDRTGKLNSASVTYEICKQGQVL